MLPDINHFPSTPAAIRRALIRHSGAGLAAFVAIVALAAVGALVMPRTFVSEAKLFVRFGRENLAVDPSATTGQVLSIYESRENEINSLLEVMRSRALLDAVAQRIGPQNILAGHVPDNVLPPTVEGAAEDAALADAAAGLLAAEPAAVQRSLTGSTVAPDRIQPPDQTHMRAVQWLEKNVFIEAPRKSSVVSISAKANSPALAQRVVAELTDLYLREHTLVHSNADSYQFFLAETKSLLNEWERASQELQSAKDRCGIITIEGRRKYLESHLEDLQTRQTANQTALAQSRARIDSLTRQLSELPALKVASSAEVPNAAADQMRNTYFQVQLQAMDLASRMEESHPLVQAARERVKDGADALAAVETSRESKTTETHPARKVLELSLLEELAHRESQQSLENQLRKMVDHAHSELKLWGEQEIQISRLQRTTELAERNYQSAAEKLEQARLSRELDQQHITNLRLVQPASFSDKPIGMGKKVVVALGGFVALIGGLGLPLCLAWLQSPEVHSLTSRLQEVSRSAAPVPLEGTSAPLTTPAPLAKPAPLTTPVPQPAPAEDSSALRDLPTIARVTRPTRPDLASLKASKTEPQPTHVSV